jgi:hypothetical protein
VYLNFEQSQLAGLVFIAEELGIFTSGGQHCTRKKYSGVQTFNLITYWFLFKAYRNVNK